ncbi:MAG TPA: hypothetical protein VJS92_11455, partial [Candidatus Polarisedimenticolaceae bacterium]|nr:hypothetical protein [Candidatus Polarisedimenticolaceae bacterium]
LPDRRTLSWTPVVAPDGAPVVYDAARGSLAALRASAFGTGAACFSSGLTAAQLDDAQAAGTEGLFYLVRARTSCAAGPYGFNDFGARETVCP